VDDVRRRFVAVARHEIAGRVERMHDGRQKQTAGLEHPIDFPERRVHVVHVHQGHEGDGQVGFAIVERQLRRIGLDVLALGISLSRRCHHRRGEVYPHDSVPSAARSRVNRPSPQPMSSVSFPGLGCEVRSCC
jgi:hypothetical protein